MTKLLGVQAMLARVWVSVKEVVVITDVVVIQYSRNLPSRCFASGTSLRSLLSSSTPDNSLLRNIFSVSSQSIYWYKKLPISLNPGTRLAFSSAAVRGWVLKISYYWSTNQRPVSWSGDHSGLSRDLPGRVDGTLGQRCWLLVIGLLQVRPLLPPLAAHDQGGLGEVTGYSIITPDMELPWWGSTSWPSPRSRCSMWLTQRTVSYYA